ncbi:hypothetical protein ACH4PU_32815 [Streptomyces sp. NPDC021100]|uniref:hypothetical protein n=1 Tax=Streptomyces sp. NPDC021100 TaxID=3365114 RepID=UPI00378FB24D
MDHGSDPDGRLFRVFPYVLDSHGVYFCEVRRLINRRREDGTWARRRTGPRGVRSSFFYVAKEQAHGPGEAAVLGAAMTVRLSEPGDEVHVYMPDRSSARVLAAVRDGASPWNGRPSHVELRRLGSRVRPALRRARIEVVLPEDPTYRAMGLSLPRAVEEQGEEIEDLVAKLRALKVKHKPRSACRCGKSRYANRAGAELALLKLVSAPGKPPRRAYQCPDSGWWHLTSQLVDRFPSPRPTA